MSVGHGIPWLWRWASAALGTLALSVPTVQAQFGNNGPPPGPFFTNWEGGTFNRDALGGFFRAAALGRVDIVCIGDSNQLLQGRGWDEAYVRVLTRRFRLYATGLLSPGENFGSGAGTGFDYGSVMPPAGSGWVFGASGPAAIFMNAPELLQPLGALSLAAGVSADPFANLGVIVHPGSDLDTSGPLRYWVAHATYPAGSGATLRLSARLLEAPFTEIAGPKLIDATSGPGGGGGGGGAGSIGAAVSFLDLPAAGPRGTRGAVNFRPTVFGAPFTGPMTQYLARVEDPRVTKGASVHTLYALGGQSARDMGAALRATSDESLTLYFSMVRMLQGPSKAVLVRIGTGVNDRAETLPPLEPTGVGPNFPASFAANLKAITDRVRHIWAVNNWPEEELYFLFAISTPITTPDDSLLQQYRDAADALTAQVPRSAVTHFERLTSVPELQANDWVLFDIDTFHLEAPGHEEMARRELGAAGMSAAWTDVNEDGVIDVEDVYRDHEWRDLARPPATGTGGTGGAGGNLMTGVTRPGDPLPPRPTSTEGYETAVAPVSPSARGLIRAARWDEAADLRSGR